MTTMNAQEMKRISAGSQVTDPEVRRLLGEFGAHVAVVAGALGMIIMA